MTEIENVRIVEKMEDAEGSEEDIMQEMSTNPNRRRHHRRGKRKRHRRRTVNLEVAKAGEIIYGESSKEALEYSKNDIQRTKDLTVSSNAEKEKTFSSMGQKVLESKPPHIEKNNLSKGRAEMKKYRHRHPPQRNINKLYNSGKANHHRTGAIANNKMLILRPNRCPDAPKNSTQFIINDHEEGEDEEKHNSGRSHESQTNSNSSRSNRTMKTSPADDFQPSPDDDTFWADYLERDFQTVYESAHREDVANWDKPKLIEEITNLEKRHKELVNKLSRLDPEIYLRRLQSRVVTKQQRNNRLKAEKKIISAVEKYKQRQGIKEFSDTEEFGRTAVNKEQCEKEECEVPSQSDLLNKEHSTTLANYKNIVSLAPDSTNE